MPNYDNIWRFSKDNGFMGMFVFSHVEDEASEHLVIFEMVKLIKDITLPNGNVLKKDTKFDAVWWHLEKGHFQFIDWKKVNPNNSEPADPSLSCSQAFLMRQGWWQYMNNCCGPETHCRCRK